MTNKLFGLIGLIVLTSCSEPQIVIHTPTPGQTFVTEGLIDITATITDNDGIKKCFCRIEYGAFSHTDTFDLSGSMPTTYDLHDMTSMTAGPSGEPTKIIIKAEDINGAIGMEEVIVNHQ